MAIKTVKILLYFGDKDKNCDVETNQVPVSLIIESLNNLTKGLCEQLVSEAKETFKTEKDQEKYLDAIIKVDRENLKKLLNE